MSYIAANDADRVFRFLAESGRIELPRASWLETSGYLEHRAEMAIRALIRQNDPDSDMSKADKVWLQTWIHSHADLINKDGVFPFLNATKREVAQSGHVKIDEVFPQQRFLIVRGKPDHPDAWLTNRLISDFVPSDFVSKYVFNKQGFYTDYESYLGSLAKPCCGRFENLISEGQGGVQGASLRPDRLIAAADRPDKQRGTLRVEGGNAMLDPIVNFFTWVFQWIGRGIGFVIGIILWPFLWAGRWYAQRGWILKAMLGVAIVGLVGLYAYFFWTTQRLDEFQSGLCRRPTSSRRAAYRPASRWRRARAPRHGQDLRPLRHR